MDDDILKEFLAESWEGLAELDRQIVELEQAPSDKSLLDAIFRTVHTIKGTCGFLGLDRLGAVAHSAENVLGRMREGELIADPALISLVLRAVDGIKGYLEHLEKDGSEGNADAAELIVNLDRVAADEITAAELEAESTPVAAVTPAKPIAQIEPQPGENSAQEEAAAEEEPSPTESESIAIEDDVPVPNRKSISDLSIRVNVDVLESLMNLVGELVLTRNQLLQLARGDEGSRYVAPITALNRVTTDLQEGVMKTRMQPIGSAWGKLPRMVRDLTQVTGKQLQLETHGAETELDRTVLEAIKDPLTHLVRNSADHGIESSDRRRERGKPEAGLIRLSAEHEGGHVVICLEDDGGGIDPEKIRLKAIERGVITEREAKSLSRQEMLALIFRPGFSTAEQISTVSGRGVGMDVVKTQIERIGGTVDLNSTLGHGTRVIIRIPLTLAIISALVVEAGGMSFAVPQLGVVELVRLATEQIEQIHDQQVFRLRDRLLPLIDLAEAIGLDNPTGSDSEAESETPAELCVVVVQVGEDQFGLVVSEVFDTEEIVVKPVGRLLKDLAIYQGTTILGDGRVIMILDVSGIAAEHGSLQHNSQNEKNADETADAADQTAMLLFRGAKNELLSVPLSLVSRLEELPLDKIERSGDGLIAQYRGQLLPLLPLEGVHDFTPSDPQPVIVFSEDEHSMGLMINRIEDILEDRLEIRLRSRRPGTLGTTILSERAVDVIDTQHYLMQAHPDWFHRTEAQTVRNVLVVDDSQFFRQLVSTALSTAGFRVKSAKDAVSVVDKWEMHPESFDVIISDIEMPMLDGFGFARYLRDRAETKTTPLIALSSLSQDSVRQTAHDAGFDRVLTKFDAAELLRTIDEIARQRVLTGNLT